MRVLIVAQETLVLKWEDGGSRLVALRGLQPAEQLRVERHLA